MDIMNSDVNSMLFDSLDVGRITTSPGYCKTHGISRKSYARKAMMTEHYVEIAKWYDKTKSVISNHRWAKDNGIKVSLSTLKRFCKYNDIPTSIKQIPMDDWYNPSLSVKENLNYA